MKTTNKENLVTTGEKGIGKTKATNEELVFQAIYEGVKSGNKVSIRVGSNAIIVHDIVVAKNKDEFRLWNEKNGLDKNFYANPDCLVAETWEKNYYFQIPQEGKQWDQCEPIVMHFSNRSDAVNAAYLLSHSHNKQIRFADNSNYTRNSGSYINHKDIK